MPTCISTYIFTHQDKNEEKQKKIFLMLSVIHLHYNKKNPEKFAASIVMPFINVMKIALNLNTQTHHSFKFIIK